jgi:hypothetical protein
MSLRIRWHPKQAISLEGTIEELTSIRDACEKIAQGRIREAKFNAAVDGSPAPYEKFLRGLRIELRPGLLDVGVTPDRWLLTAGNENALHSAGSYFDFAGKSLGPHTHLEWYEGHPVLEPGAEPLVVSIARLSGSALSTPD